MSQVSRQQRRASERASRKNGHASGVVVGDNPELVPLPDEAPVPGTPDGPPNQQLPDGVWILVTEEEADGKRSFTINVNTTGATKPTEVYTLLMMAIKKHKAENGLD